MYHRLLTAALVAGVAGMAFGTANAQTPPTRTIYAAMTFKAEAGPRRTSACLQLAEHDYPATAWWETPAASGPDRAFTSVIAAITKQDRGALLKLTDPAEARNATQFDRQASAFFQQFQTIRMVSVRHAYEFDGLVTYFGTFRSATQTAIVPLVFAYEGEDTFGFLPSRSRKPSFSVVSDWYAPDPASPPEAPNYCTDAEVKRATHRVAIGSSTWRPALLHLTGAPLDAPGPLAATAASVKATIDQMKAALRDADANIEPFARFMTPEGALRLRDWFARATTKERDDYKTAFANQQPFFVFDESPLVVVYTKTRDSGVQVLYFTVSADKRLLWTNSSHITTSDQIFKEGPLFAAASAPRPFSTLVIR